MPYFVLVVSELCAVFLLVHYQRMESVHQVYTILPHSYVVPVDLAVAYFADGEIAPEYEA